MVRVVGIDYGFEHCVGAGNAPPHGESTDNGGTKDRHLTEYECLADFAEGDTYRLHTPESVT
jgi:hypothetical protein